MPWHRRISMNVDVLYVMLTFFPACDAVDMAQVCRARWDVLSHRMNAIAKLIIIFCFAIATSLK